MRTILASILLASAYIAGAHEKFEILEGDRIALVGDTLIEREQASGWLQTEMAVDFPERHFIVRNLGWSGDSPAGASRASFDFADKQKGFELLTNEIAQVNPTVVVLGYGMANSFSGASGIDSFKAEITRLMDAVSHNATNGPIRFVILSPLHHEKMPAPLPDPTAQNAHLALYAEALRSIAQHRGLPFIDLFDWKPSLHGDALTDNGIHLTAEGYRLMAREIARQCAWPAHSKRGREVVLESLRQEVIHKDHLFFDRWRPQNETYLFGFRKYEQGKNAHEIPAFDPLVAAVEARIDTLQDLYRIGANSIPVMDTPQGPWPYVSSNQPMPKFTMADGLEATLWAEDPLLAKPIQMNFDPQGRLWVASSAVYPQIAPGQTADDKIVVLEDTNGSGHANKSTVFADHLFIPQGVVPGDGGCYVGQSTELLHFKGKLGSGKPPERRVVLSGFGTEDTHHMVHTLKWGPDGMLYFDQSIYIHSHIETPNGVVRLNSGGLFHLRVPTMDLGIFLRGFCNPWGHQFDQYGQSFVTDGAGGQGITWGMPDATYFTYAIMRKELASVSPGAYPKFCGLEIVQSQQFPKDWQGDFITADFRAHRVVHFSISEDGSGYVTKQLPDIMTSTNVSFRPIDEKFGPDGALYIADWANPIINHGEVDFRDSRRDHDQGRIWRVTAKGRPLLQKHDLAQLSNTRLFDTLLSSNVFEVEQSRRVLAERGKSILGELAGWAKGHTNPKAQLEALWMYQAVDVPNFDLLHAVLKSPDGHVRAAAVRVMSYWNKGLREPDSFYVAALSDSFPRVREEALRAVAQVPSLKSAELALNTVNLPTDTFLDYARWLTINQLAQPFLDGLKSGAYKIEGHHKELVFALDSIEPEQAGPALSEILKRDKYESWTELIGRAGLAADVEQLWARTLKHEFDSAKTAQALNALSVAAGRGISPAKNLEGVTQFFSATNSSVQLSAIKLAGVWGGPGESRTRITDIAAKTETTEPMRMAAFGAIRKIGGTNMIHELQPLTASNQPVSIRQPAVLTLMALDAAHAASNVVAYLASITNEETALTVWRQALGNEGAAIPLARALPRSGFPNVVGKAGLRAVRESSRNEPELVVALTRAAGLQGAEVALTAAEIKKLGEQSLAHGDPARGEKIFRSQQQSCTSCHSIGGVGGKVAPDMTSIGASSPIDYLIESVLYPNKQIKDGYQAYLIETKDGEDISGIPIKENDRELVVRTASDQAVTVLKSDIKTKKPGGSLMPAGLTDNLSQQEQFDLYRFLSELGKPGAYDAAKGNVARMWMVSVAPTNSGEEQKLLGSSLTGTNWHRAYSYVNGQTLGADLRKASLASTAGSATLLAATHFQTSKAAKVKFDLTAPENALLWIDGKAMERKGNAVATDLPAGMHTVVVKLEGKIVKDTVVLKSDDGTFTGS